MSGDVVAWSGRVAESRRKNHVQKTTMTMTTAFQVWKPKVFPSRIERMSAGPTALASRLSSRESVFAISPPPSTSWKKSDDDGRDGALCAEHVENASVLCGRRLLKDRKFDWMSFSPSDDDETGLPMNDDYDDDRTVDDAVELRSLEWRLDGDCRHGSRLWGEISLWIFLRNVEMTKFVAVVVPLVSGLVALDEYEMIRSVHQIRSTSPGRSVTYHRKSRAPRNAPFSHENAFCACFAYAFCVLVHHCIPPEAGGVVVAVATTAVATTAVVLVVV